MALTGGGYPLSLDDIQVELGRHGGDADASITDMAQANSPFPTINTASASYPNSTAPHQVSEWYSYNHSAVASFSGIFVDDFYTTGGDDPTDARINYSTTGLQDSQSFVSDIDGNTVTTRPVWTYNNGGSGTSHQSNDRIAYLKVIIGVQA